MLDVAFELINFMDVLAELSISSDEAEFLKSLANSAGRYPDFAKVLTQNPEVESNLIEVANRSFGNRLEEPITSTTVALSMIGFTPARNYLAASIIRKNHHFTPWDDTIKEILNFALEGELIGGALASKYFAAGLVYDFILHALKRGTRGGLVQSNPKFVGDIWAHSLQVCAISRNLSRVFFPDMDLEKELCFHALLHDLGKLIYCFMDEEYMLQQTSTEVIVTSNFPETAWAKETAHFGLSHDIIGHMALWQLGFLPDTNWIVLYHHQPFLAARRGEAAHLHTTLIWLADQISKYREFHRSSKFSDRILTGWYNILKPFLQKTDREQFREEVSRLAVR